MLSIPLIVIAALMPVLDDLRSYGQPSANIWGDQLFVAVTQQLQGSSMLYRGQFSPRARAIRSPIEHDNPYHFSDPSSQAKLDIRNDRVLLFSGEGGYHIIPLEVIPFMENSAFGAKLRILRTGPDKVDGPSRETDPIRAWLADVGVYSNLIAPYYAKGYDVVFPEHRKHDVEVTDKKEDDGDKPSLETYYRIRRFTLQAAGPNSVRLFHAYKDKLFVSIEPDYINWYLDDDGKPLKDKPKPPDRELRTGNLPVNFTEHFAAYTSGKNDYLVTPNGKVYMSVPKGKDEVEITLIWVHARKPIVGVVQDLANGEVYGWGYVGEATDGNRFYMRFEPKPTDVAYKLTVPLWNDRSDAYLESYECARAFRAAGK
jgi:hypothetical protein